MVDPPTVIVVHPRERRSKCTVEALRERPGFVFWKFPRTGPEPLDGYLRLGLGGPPLSPEERGRGLLVLDGTWRLAGKMQPQFDDLPVYSLHEWQTAYPRDSKLFTDPAGGLATIEAIFAAYVQMGRDPAGLLDGYFWREQFLEQNADLLQKLRSDA
ncbi:MAG: DTW domain-containing protein [Planctomycetota bacterium]|nr:MAG: DTW domain-containing protein [Planctomycetota bacterium]REJ97057.1 MAG: DTW domain-containing protein [Planctomycetota bacterium]REK20593.1 MAG: DTW domain-containing protein [Planctomycetota bacterium]REK35082.1 MAG: DTW domain-containing protein [Planctomycetota bacterium]